MDPETTDFYLRRHLVRNQLLQPENPTCWKIENFGIRGRGLIATRDIQADELVYKDASVVEGPRSYAKYLSFCVTCYKSNCALFPCDGGCGLPVCSDVCQNDTNHVKSECAYLSSLEPNCGTDWSIELLQAVVPIRALHLPLEQREIFYIVTTHEAAQHGREVDMLKKNVKNPLKPEDEELMRRVCRAMDTNSFEMLVVQGESSTSLRALFPIGALTNHQCVPNTHHLINDKRELLVYSTMPIAKGDEITMTYVDIFWDTMMRRQLLLSTKHFSCLCTRCADATECGSFLGALKCASDTCTGNLLPDDPLNCNSAWTCNTCNLIIKSKQIKCIRAGISAAVEEVLSKNPRQMLRFIKRELCILVPETNYMMMEMMFCIVSLFGRIDGMTWQDLSEDELNVKIEFCNKLIHSLDQLNSGNCTKKGLILYEMYCTNIEILKRISSKNENMYILLKHEVNERFLCDAMKILKCNVATPNDYRDIYIARSKIVCEV